MNVMTTVSATPRRGLFSRDEFERMVAAGAFTDIWVELIGGELHRMPPPGNSHGRLQAAVIVELARCLASDMVRGEIGIDLGEDTVVGADAAVLVGPSAVAGWIKAADLALVVEIAISTRDRDLGLKRRLYAAAGIPAYWVIDAERRVIHVFDGPKGDDYLGLALVRFGEPLTVPGTDGAIVLD